MRKTLDRRALLLSTALASVAVFAPVTAPTPAMAQVTCPPGTFPPPGPISILTPAGSIDCVNTFDRNIDGAPGRVITLNGDDPNESVTLDNIGNLTATYAGGTAYGVVAVSAYDDVWVKNSGDIRATGDSAFGIRALISTPGTRVTVHNSGDIDAVSAGGSTGLFARDYSGGSHVEVHNTGDVYAASSGETAIGINANTGLQVEVTNSGDLDAIAREFAVGIYGRATAPAGGSLFIDNSGGISVTTTDLDGRALGIYAPVTSLNGSTVIQNSGDIFAKALGDDSYAQGIRSSISGGGNATLEIRNAGAIHVEAESSGSNAAGIYARGYAPGSSIDIHNSGEVDVVAGEDAFGIDARSFDHNSPIGIENRGPISATGGDDAFGILAFSRSPISIVNEASVAAKAGAGYARGLYARTVYANSAISIDNRGDVHASSSGDKPGVTGAIVALTNAPSSSITIRNAGSVFAAGGLRNVGIYTYSKYVNPTTITNTGDVSSESYLAIDVKGAGTADIFNAGLITGFVDLTEQNDRFFNQSGGVFETKRTSFFGGGNDLFVNERGGTVLAATDRTMSETSAFEGLETFRNRGLITLIDRQAGDRFAISNTPGGTDLNFQGGGQLGLDVFLDGATSPADKFFVEGNVSGTTTVIVNNTNLGPGTFNSGGIPVIFVDGNTPSESNFQLLEPIDTGLFDYDLFFVPTNSGFWELRSFPGGSAHALPKLLTAAQDLWHQTSATWFDRTADLRVVLNGGSAPGGA
ncbi:MAG: autotransporter outer membrane beta-barrel domain-containing protein, partial [Methyloceanibacter sp.]|nr:autotransporter outer membrane beta-barrel domain-containing protein [Methyloceanibacter sp.]